MPKRQLTPQPDGHHTAKRRNKNQQQQPPPPPQRHVYLVVDDWERGYSVRKIDVDAFCECNLQEGEVAPEPEPEPEPLPEPPAVRFEGHHGRLWFFGAHGTKILALPAYGAADFPVYDTETLGITLCSHPAGHKVRGPPVLVSVAGMLYMLVECSLAMLGAPPPPNSDENKTWAWTFMPEHLPFEAPYVKSLAVHPDGRTLFVSAKGKTFSLNTDSLKWTCQGNWVLPFSG
uniref:Uncharacterized protein n=1 Tax=Avena sativa TaxID=4498 RepID=A0ACD6ABT7_AVESA